MLGRLIQTPIPKRAVHLCCTLLICICVLVVSAKAQEATPRLMVVVSRESPIITLSSQDVSLIYLGKKTLWEGDLRLSPALLRESHPAMQYFIEKKLGKSVGQFRAYWRKLLFSGSGTVPKSFRREEELFQYLENNPGAVGLCTGEIPLPPHLKELTIEDWKVP